ncbi:aryl-alcohol dehydrogenase-like predicted oxidoreductase [Kitasatospora gansuensis]|uniref:Aryl-alcohol dehydrogenase-like predicted oxidoreductase n=1 Tax=Kitasatospora gansuensis TaxID=258050 RepID=A0A7W7SF47_9ACTN|nr:aldo/keto reductase [Kitasatospora gansuensis]MBB4948221.1 aryl-alcohol dehydrogenase-like predicted oxidoreductase [Kitasatospora gansuensis]
MRARLGLGTYRCRDVRRDAMMAASLGADWVDTAANYSHGQAENALAPVLVRHPDLKVSTKVGFIPADTGRIAVRAGMLTPADARRGHCLAPGYVAWQVTRSARRLGRAPDIVFVHNPEHDCPPGAVTERLYAAFLALEEACNQGVIKAYGVATWRGFSSGVFDVADLVALAVRAGGLNHHLSAVQLPVSVVHLAPVGLALDGLGVLVEAASAGLEVFASAPLHGGEIPDMVGLELAELITPGSTPAEAALAVVASAPGISRVLLSTGNPQHWSRAADAVGRAPLSQDLLRKVTDVLGT